MIFYFFPDNLEVLKNIAILIGAFGGIAAFLTLIIKDQFKIKQIDKLSSIALNQEDQITELRRSVEQLTLIAKYQNTFNGLYAKGLEIAKGRQKLEQDLKKLELRPEFGSNGATNLIYRFKNVGEKAEILSVDILEGENAIFLSGIIKGDTIKKGQIFSIEIDRRIEIEKRANNKVCINFEDSIGTEYYQIIDFQQVSYYYKPHLSKVIEVEEDSTSAKGDPEAS